MSNMIKTLRNRIEQSERLARWIGNVLGAYLALCQRTTRWTVEGVDALSQELADGPVVVTLWHSRSLMGPLHWPGEVAPLTSLHDGSPIGRVGGQVQRYFGLTPYRMSGPSAKGAPRAILRRLRDGSSIAMVGDGPRGPARVLNQPIQDWIRIARRPVWCYAYSTSRQRRAKSWDTQLIPLPFARGAIVFARHDGQDLSASIDAVTARADRIAGLAPGP